eukprot:4076281-Pyramimonas_sp.AAC.1
MPQEVRLFVCPASSAFRADCEDVSSEVLFSALPRGEPPGGSHDPIRFQIVGMPQVVCLSWCPTSSAPKADCEDVSRQALVVSSPWRSRRGVLHPPILPHIVGCLR